MPLMICKRSLLPPVLDGAGWAAVGGAAADSALAAGAGAVTLESAARLAAPPLMTPAAAGASGLGLAAAGGDDVAGSAAAADSGSLGSGANFSMTTAGDLGGSLLIGAGRRGLANGCAVGFGVGAIMYWRNQPTTMPAINAANRPILCILSYPKCVHFMQMQRSFRPRGGRKTFPMLPKLSWRPPASASTQESILLEIAPDVKITGAVRAMDIIGRLSVLNNLWPMATMQARQGTSQIGARPLPALCSAAPAPFATPWPGADVAPKHNNWERRCKSE